jgi:hypothetical protein
MPRDENHSAVQSVSLGMTPLHAGPVTTHETSAKAGRTVPRRRYMAVVDALMRRGFPSGTPKYLVFIGTAAVVAGAALIAATAAIHLHLWLIGYRHVPRIGPLFLVQAITGLVLAPVLMLGRHLITVLAGAGYMAASVVGLLLSATMGFLGIHDGLGVPWATTSLSVELAGMVLLGGAAAISLWRLIFRP